MSSIAQIFLKIRKTLVSRKVVYRKVCTEVSGTTNVCTNEQEPDKRHICVDEQAHHCEVQRVPKAHVCRSGGDRQEAIYLTKGGLLITG